MPPPARRQDAAHNGAALLTLSALNYAQYGWAVLPLHTPRNGLCSCGRHGCASPGKHPRATHGVKDATTDRQVVDRWWSRWPLANIGIATGDLVVIDIDGTEGRQSLRRLHSRPEQQVSREELLDHMARLLLYGMRLSGDGTPPPTNGRGDRSARSLPPRSS